MLEGKYQDVAADIRERMETAAERLEFEQAAVLRDRLKAVESLSQKQLVTAGTMANTDVIGYYQSEAKACFAVLHFVDGNLLDKDYEILTPSETPEETVSSLVKQYYPDARRRAEADLPAVRNGGRGAVRGAFAAESRQKGAHQSPQRGDNVKLVELANKKCARGGRARHEQAGSGSMARCGCWRGCSGGASRCTGWNPCDISHIAGTDIVASMVVFCDGAPSKRTISASN